MIDMHSHILPYIDDGAKDVEMSLAMLKLAKEQGVKKVAATPHCFTSKQDGIDGFLKKRQDSYEKLMSAMDNKDDYPEIILGAEIHLACDMGELPNISSLCYQNTNYILLEIPDGYNPATFAEWVYNISIKGLRPVIAHIDRYKGFQDFMEELVPLDVVFQVNATQFSTLSGRMLLKKIFKKHNKFIVSSDMHNLTSRPCNIGTAFASAQKKFPGFCPMLFNDGAQAILGNKDFPIL